jgi:hypothetical protein
MVKAGYVPLEGLSVNKRDDLNNHSLEAQFETLLDKGIDESNLSRLLWEEDFKESDLFALPYTNRNNIFAITLPYIKQKWILKLNIIISNLSKGTILVPEYDNFLPQTKVELSNDNIHDFVLISRPQAINNEEQLYVLSDSGCSLKNSRIQTGDKVLIKSQTKILI